MTVEDRAADIEHHYLIHTDVVLTIHADGVVELTATVDPDWLTQVAAVADQWAAVDADQLSPLQGTSFMWPLE